MESRRIVFTLLIIFTFCSFARGARVVDQGVLLTRDDAIGVCVGLGFGGSTFITLKILEDTIFKNKKYATISEVGIAVGAALFSGFTAYFISSYFSAKNRKDLENYSRALEIFESVKNSDLALISIDSIKKFVRDHFMGPAPFGLAMGEIDTLCKKLEEAVMILNVVFRRSEIRGGKNKISFDEKCKKLEKEINVLYQDLVERKLIIANEFEYERSEISFFKLKGEVEEILESALISSVKESFEKTVEHCSSRIEDLWPMVLLVEQLRNIINKNDELLKKCINEKNNCEQKVEKDDRYEVLTKNYINLCERLKNDFPLEIFEKRITEICSSDEYKAQILLLDRDKKHREVVKILEVIKDDLKGIVDDVKDEMIFINKNISKVGETVDDVKAQVLLVKGDVLDTGEEVKILQKDVERVNNGVLEIKGDISKLAKDIVGSIKNGIEKISQGTNNNG